MDRPYMIYTYIYIYMGNSFVTDMTNDSFFIILNHFLAKNRDLAKIYLIDIEENMC